MTPPIKRMQSPLRSQIAYWLQVQIPLVITLILRRPWKQIKKFVWRLYYASLMPCVVVFNKAIVFYSIIILPNWGQPSYSILLPRHDRGILSGNSHLWRHLATGSSCSVRVRLHGTVKRGKFGSLGSTPFPFTMRLIDFYQVNET